MIDIKINEIIVNKNISNEEKCSLIVQLIKNDDLLDGYYENINENISYYRDFCLNLLNEKNILNEYKTNIFCSFLYDELDFEENIVFSNKYKWTNIEEHL